MLIQIQKAIEYTSLVDPDPELLFQIQKNMKEQINKNVISLWILGFVY